MERLFAQNAIPDPLCLEKELLSLVVAFFGQVQECEIIKGKERCGVFYSDGALQAIQGSLQQSFGF
jgi:hypothetical protein